MDNNFNQGQPMQQQAPVDPFAQSQMYAQQAAQNQMYAQQAAPNQMYAQQMYAQQAPKQPSNFNLFEMLSLILAGAGMFMTFLGTILTCSCSASKSMEGEGFSTSAVFILTIFGIIAAIGGVVLAIMAMKDTKATVKAGKFSKIAAVLGIFAIIWGVLPTTFICAYNCSLESEMEESIEDAKDSLKDSLGGYGDLGSLFD